MELITTFESLSKTVLEKYDEDISVTMGILIADYRQTDAREYILNYLNRFDERSGKYIDFYLPGYYMFSKENPSEWEKRSHQNICISRHCSSNGPVFMSRLNEKFYFDDYLFDEFLREFEDKTNISYTYGPMLVLVEVNKRKGYGNLEFQKKIVIDLDDGTYRGVRKSGMLFEQIFDIAKREVGLNRFSKELKMYYFKGNIERIISQIITGNLIDAIDCVGEGIKYYRIR